MDNHTSILFGALDEAQLEHMACTMAPTLSGGGVIFLQGELGAGKTTFARALLRAMGVSARVKSPTYSLIESYCIGQLSIQHLDLYRIAAIDEVEWLGLGDLADTRTLWLIEWPERAMGALPNADLIVNLAHAPTGRNIHLNAVTSVGARALEAAQADLQISIGTGS